MRCAVAASVVLRSPFSQQRRPKHKQKKTKIKGEEESPRVALAEATLGWHVLTPSLCGHDVSLTCLEEGRPNALLSLKVFFLRDLNPSRWPEIV